MSSDRGASLLEALIAVAVVTTVCAGLAQLLMWSRRAAWTSGAQSLAVVFAAQKLEQLRSLAWSIDLDRAVLSDEWTDTGTDPFGEGGTGLQPSPPGTLDANTSGFVDYLDAAGVWQGTGARPPRTAFFVRRWAIKAFAPDSANTLVLTVTVAALGDDTPARVVRLQTIRTRVLE